MEAPKPREARSHGSTRKFPDEVRERAVRLVFDVEQEASSVSEAAVGSGSSASSWKIIPGGSSGGRMPPVRASWGQRLLAGTSVRAGQVLYGRYSDALVVHGKEKVYGSIP